MARPQISMYGRKQDFALLDNKCAGELTLDQKIIVELSAVARSHNLGMTLYSNCSY